MTAGAPLHELAILLLARGRRFPDYRKMAMAPRLEPTGHLIVRARPIGASKGDGWPRKKPLDGGQSSIPRCVGTPSLSWSKSRSTRARYLHDRVFLGAMVVAPKTVSGPPNVAARSWLHRAAEDPQIVATRLVPGRKKDRRHRRGGRARSDGIWRPDPSRLLRRL